MLDVDVSVPCEFTIRSDIQTGYLCVLVVFQRWWHDQKKKSTSRCDCNEGWCMLDEATTHCRATVDQTAYGHKLLYKPTRCLNC